MKIKFNGNQSTWKHFFATVYSEISKKGINLASVSKITITKSQIIITTKERRGVEHEQV